MKNFRRKWGQKIRQLSRQDPESRPSETDTVEAEESIHDQGPENEASSDPRAPATGQSCEEQNQPFGPSRMKTGPQVVRHQPQENAAERITDAPSVATEKQAISEDRSDSADKDVATRKQETSERDSMYSEKGERELEWALEHVCDNVASVLENWTRQIFEPLLHRWGSSFGSLQQEVQTIGRGIYNLEQRITRLASNNDDLGPKIGKLVHQELDAAQRKTESRLDLLESRQSERSELEAEITRLSSELEGLSKVDEELKKSKSDLADAKQRISRLERDHSATSKSLAARNEKLRHFEDRKGIECALSKWLWPQPIRGEDFRQWREKIENQLLSDVPISAVRGVIGSMIRLALLGPEEGAEEMPEDIEDLCSALKDLSVSVSDYGRRENQTGDQIVEQLEKLARAFGETFGGVIRIDVPSIGQRFDSSWMSQVSKTGQPDLRMLSVSGVESWAIITESGGVVHTARVYL